MILWHDNCALKLGNSKTLWNMLWNFVREPSFRHASTQIFRKQSLSKTSHISLSIHAIRFYWNVVGLRCGIVGMTLTEKTLNWFHTHAHFRFCYFCGFGIFVSLLQILMWATIANFNILLLRNFFLRLIYFISFWFLFISCLKIRYFFGCMPKWFC